MKIGLLIFVLTICLNSLVYCQSLDRYTPLTSPAKIEYRSKKDPKNIPTIFGEELDLKVTVSFPTMKDGKIATEIVTSTISKDLIFADEEGVLTSRLNYYLRVTSQKDRKVLGFAEDTKTTSVHLADFDKQKNQSVIFESLLKLPPGKYIIDIVLRDTLSGNKGILTYKFEVPVAAFTATKPQ